MDQSHTPPAASRVLIVDDDEGVRAILTAWLSKAGYASAQAADAESAIPLLETQAIGVVLCDQNMPGRGGQWLVGQIRERFSSVAVILATGADVPRSVGEQRGIVGHLEKPFTRPLLLGAVADAMVWHRVASKSRR